MLLFHVNRDRSIIKEFVPKIPEMSITQEEPKIQRICVSESIDGCFSAVIFGGHELQYSMFLNELYDDHINTGTQKHAKFKLYVFDTKDIAPENIIDSKGLKERNLVSDCLVTKEYWVINQTLRPTEIIEIEVHSSELVYTECHRLDGTPQRLALNTNIKGIISTCFVRTNGNEYTQSHHHMTNKLIQFDAYFNTYHK